MNRQSFLLAVSSVFFGVAGVYCFLYPKDSLEAMDGMWVLSWYSAEFQNFSAIWGM